MNKKNIVILISGIGSNMQSIVNANISNINISAIISNNPKSEGLIWAQNKGLNTFCINHNDFQTRQAFEYELIKCIDKFNPTLIVLAGFKRILSDLFCNKYLNKIINIHPSLLPAFVGLNTHKRALEYGCKITGCTIHFVTCELDNGPIIAQIAIPIKANDSADTLNKRTLEYEHQIYPKVINDLVNDHLILKDGKVFNKIKVNDFNTSVLINI